MHRTQAFECKHKGHTLKVKVLLNTEKSLTNCECSRTSYPFAQSFNCNCLVPALFHGINQFITFSDNDFRTIS